jgi:hypothetical protein
MTLPFKWRTTNEHHQSRAGGCHAQLPLAFQPASSSPSGASNPGAVLTWRSKKLAVTSALLSLSSCLLILFFSENENGY